MSKPSWKELCLIKGDLTITIRGDRCGVSGIESGPAVSQVDMAIVNKIRNLLTLNVQRTTSPPLFAAIGDAETDSTRKQCLVKALEAVDIPVVFEYITANQQNLIEMIQRLGRSRKCQRED